MEQAIVSGNELKIVAKRRRKIYKTSSAVKRRDVSLVATLLVFLASVITTTTTCIILHRVAITSKPKRLEWSTRSIRVNISTSDEDLSLIYFWRGAAARDGDPTYFPGFLGAKL